MALFNYAQAICFIVSLLTVAAEGDIFVYSDDPPLFIMEKFRDMPASFGEVIEPEGLRAYVVPSTPSTACTAILPPPNINITIKWVVLIARLNCSFETKIRNAQNAGYHGAIVHNVDSNDLQVMYAKNPEGISIPSVFVGEDAGLILKLNYLYNESYFVVINGELPYDLNHLLIPFLIVVSLSVIILSVFMIVKCVRDRRRDRRHRLSKNSLKKIPTCKFTKGDPYDMCAICLDDYIEGDKLRVLPCAHAYHCKCIDPWLTKNRRVCPVCKRKVFVSNERVTSRNSTVHSDNDSDSDDSVRAPLLAPRNGPNGPQTTTQGGTFTFTENERSLMNDLRHSFNGNILEETATEPNVSDTSNETTERIPQTFTAVRGSPFLRGFLNMRSVLLPLSQNDTDREPLVPSAVTTQRVIEVDEDEDSSVSSSLHPIAEVQEPQDNAGRIGVVALPHRDNDNDSYHSVNSNIV